jgi:hypothetical protein
MHRILFVVILYMVCLTGIAEAQVVVPSKKNKNWGVFNITQIGYNRGVGKIKGDNYVFLNRGSVFRLRTTFGYFLKPTVSLGLGFGLDGYHNPGYNTAPLVADVRYYLNPTGNSLFFSGNLGYSLKLAEPFAQGIYTSANMGFRSILGKQTHLLLSAGIDGHQIKDAVFYVYDPNRGFERVETNIWLQSISFNAGFLF